jgi:hypothetical protein
MAMFMLDHRHLPDECRIAFAAWRGFDSPLRHDAAFSSCGSGNGACDEHRIWWTVEAADANAALAMLPPYVAERTEVNPIGEVRIP